MIRLERNGRMLEAMMRVTMTGATGLIGERLVRALTARGDEVTVLSRSGGAAVPGAQVLRWANPTTDPAPAEALDGRDVSVRTGIVLAAGGGALEKMLPFFRLGIGGPVAGGRQYMPWIHLDDLVGIYLAALDGEGWSRSVNGSAPEPVTNKAFSQT